MIYQLENLYSRMTINNKANTTMAVQSVWGAQRGIRSRTYCWYYGVAGRRLSEGAFKLRGNSVDGTDSQILEVACFRRGRYFPSLTSAYQLADPRHPNDAYTTANSWDTYMPYVCRTSVQAHVLGSFKCERLHAHYSISRGENLTVESRRFFGPFLHLSSKS